MRILKGLDLDISLEEHRQAESDRISEVYPVCICCKHSIFGCDTYRVIGRMYICGDCDSISEVGCTNDLEV